MKDKRSPLASDERQEYQTEERTFTCSECGQSFAKPLLANVSSQGVIQTYYACPRCLAEVQENDKAGTSPPEPSVAREELREEEPKPEKEDCQHFLGYLRKRPREAAIPEACLTCRRIIECMSAS